MIYALWSIVGSPNATSILIPSLRSNNKKMGWKKREKKKQQKNKSLRQILHFTVNRLTASGGVVTDTAVELLLLLWVSSSLWPKRRLQNMSPRSNVSLMLPLKPCARKQMTMNWKRSALFLLNIFFLWRNSKMDLYRKPSNSGNRADPNTQACGRHTRKSGKRESESERVRVRVRVMCFLFDLDAA